MRRWTTIGGVAIALLGATAVVLAQQRPGLFSSLTVPGASALTSLSSGTTTAGFSVIDGSLSANVPLKNAANVFATNGQQINTVGSAVTTVPLRPLALSGSDGATSGIVASLYSNVSGRQAGLHLSDGFTYNLTIGADSGGGLDLFAGRYPGVAGTNIYRVDATGNVYLGGSNVTDALAVPTWASGFGGLAGDVVITGRDYAFKVALLSTGTGVLNFATTYANAPACVASYDGGGSTQNGYVMVTTTTTQVSVVTYSPSGSNFAAGFLAFLCRGF